MKQLYPDWSNILPKEMLQKQYTYPFTYVRPGLYLTATDTLLIQEDDSGNLHFHCYNCPLSEIVWGDTIPTQFDNR